MQGSIVAELYRHFDAANKLLYVGVSLSTLNRLGQHKDHSHWFTTIARVEVSRFPTRADALAAERLAIQVEAPAHNIRHARTHSTQPTGWDITRKELIHHVVRVDPVYTIAEASILLKVGQTQVKRWMEQGLLGYFEVPGRGRQLRRVSGWQLIDLLENLEKRLK
jgi:hypothetical protein